MHFTKLLFKFVNVIELHDHLGNVRAVVGTTPPTHPFWSHFSHTTPPNRTVPILAYYNYYAFGSYEPNRVYMPSEVSFAFNGQERNDDYMGPGNENHALFWEYDTRIGKRWDIDPVINPTQSPYAVNNNNPIQYNDPSGESGVATVDKEHKKVIVQINVNLYGSMATKELAIATAQSIEKLYNANNPTVKIGKAVYKVQFQVKGNYINSNGMMNEIKTAATIINNKDPRNNYYRVEKNTPESDGVSFTQGLNGGGGNSGMFKHSEIAHRNQTTAAHEIGHGLGLHHNNDNAFRINILGTPNIMDIRGDIPDQKFAIKTGPDAGTLDIDKRIIDKTNIDNIFNSEVIKEL